MQFLNGFRNLDKRQFFIFYLLDCRFCSIQTLLHFWQCLEGCIHLSDCRNKIVLVHPKNLNQFCDNQFIRVELNRLVITQFTNGKMQRLIFGLCDLCVFCWLSDSTVHGLVIILHELLVT